MKAQDIRILHLDSNHPLLVSQLDEAGFTNDIDFISSKSDILKKIYLYEGIVIRSRFSIDEEFFKHATNLQFIARVGAGLENIDAISALKHNVKLIAAPEGNRNAVGEHTLGMILSLFNKLNSANTEIHSGLWRREENRGHELDGKTVGIIGYGNMGKSFAQKLRGFNVQVLCYDIKDTVGDENAKQVSLAELQEKSDVLSLHLPFTEITNKMVNQEFIASFAKQFWLINTSRGKNVVTADVVDALQSGKILGAGLDVLEFEKSSFEDMFDTESLPQALSNLLQFPNVLLTPHVAGWTFESHEKLAQVIVDKIKLLYSR